MNAQVLVAGATSGAWASDSAGGDDFAAFLLDTGTPASTSPLPVPTQSPEPSVLPSAAPTRFVETNQPTRQPSAATPPLHSNTESPSARPTSPPTRVTNDRGVATPTMVAVLLGGLGLICVLGAGWLCRRGARRRNDVAKDYRVASIGLRHRGTPLPQTQLFDHDRGTSSPAVQPSATVTGATSSTSPETMSNGKVASGNYWTEADLSFSDACPRVIGDRGRDDIHDRHPSSVETRNNGCSELSTLAYKESLRGVRDSGGSGNEPMSCSQAPPRGIGVPRAVMEAAQEMARLSQIPVVAEVAGLVAVLMNMVTDRSELIGAADNMAKRCRTVLLLLHRAASVLKEVCGSASGCRVCCSLRALYGSSETLRTNCFMCDLQRR